MENKLLYSVLFLKGRNGTTTKELANLLEISDADAKKQIKELTKELKDLDWPLDVKETDSKVRLAVSKETSLELSKKMKKTINVSLTKSVLEVLTIIAYKQPTTKPDIENIRGVSADYSIAKLLEYELIESNGRAELPGNPRLYVTTNAFLELFDLQSLEELPTAASDFEEKTQEMTLFTYDADMDEQSAENSTEDTNDSKEESDISELVEETTEEE